MIFPIIFASIYGNICIEWGEVQSVGQMDPIINESSGLVMLAWIFTTHNDSGDGLSVQNKPVWCLIADDRTTARSRLIGVPHLGSLW